MKGGGGGSIWKIIKIGGWIVGWRDSWLCTHSNNIEGKKREGKEIQMMQLTVVLL